MTPARLHMVCPECGDVYTVDADVAGGIVHVNAVDTVDAAAHLWSHEYGTQHDTEGQG